MNTSKNFDVGGLLSPLSGHGVEKQLSRLPGVTAVSVNPAAGSATVSFDDTATTPLAIRQAIEACGFHCSGEATPRHVCGPDQPAMDHGAMAARDGMAHDMGHGAGMDARGMARDMRNRFWICLAFTIPIFLYAPMGMEFMKLEPPFGLRLNLWLFILATGAVIYPAWPAPAPA